MKYFAIFLLFLLSAPVILALGATIPIRNYLFEPIWPDEDEVKLQLRYTRADIAVGGDVEKLNRIYKALKQNAASPEEAPQYNRVLNVAIVNFADDLSTSAGAPRPRDLSVDLGEAGRAGILLIADRPMILSILNARRTGRAKVAVESNSAFSLKEAPGVIAGFRVGAFGADDVTKPADILTPQEADLKRFCRSVALWAKFFDLRLADIRFWTFRDPKVLKLSELGIGADGASPQGPRSVEFECNPPRPTRRPTDFNRNFPIEFRIDHERRQ
jgi:hypothetical protein